jgi:hypothetical protein
LPENKTNNEIITKNGDSTAIPVKENIISNNRLSIIS